MKNDSPLVKFISGVVIILAFCFIARYLYLNWNEVKNFNWHINYSFLCLSMIFLCVPFIMMAFGWYFILIMLKCRVNAWDCVRIYVLSQLARYIPGKIFMFIGRVIMAEKMGVKKTVSSISVFVEAILSTSGAFFAILILYMFSSKIRIEWINPFYTAFIIIIGLAALNPKLIKYVLIFLLKNKEILDFDWLDFKYYKILLMSTFYTIQWILVGISFYFFVSAILGQMISPKYFFDTACLFLISWLIGFLSFITPGGIGVREAILTAGLQSLVPVYLAGVIAISSRIWFTVGELLGVIIVSTFKIRR
ncbi:MAG: flippase-like domain-containing protein [Desulfobacterales bacterium]|nr:flippase-like domain-containing protein [Desulfobacterales bacterium]